MRRKKRATGRPRFPSTAACIDAIRDLFDKVVISLRADPDIDDPVRYACRLFGATIREAQSQLPQKPGKSSSRVMAKRDAALLTKYEAARRRGRGHGVKVLASFAEKHKLGKIRKGPVIFKGDNRTKPTDIAKRIMLREKRRQQQLSQTVNEQ